MMILKVAAHSVRLSFPLGHQFSCIKVSHHGLKDICGEEWQHALVIVLDDAGVDAWELTGHQPEEDIQCDVDNL